MLQPLPDTADHQVCSFSSRIAPTGVMVEFFMPRHQLAFMCTICHTFKIYILPLKTNPTLLFVLFQIRHNITAQTCRTSIVSLHSNTFKTRPPIMFDTWKTFHRHSIALNNMILVHWHVFCCVDNNSRGLQTNGDKVLLRLDFLKLDDKEPWWIAIIAFVQTSILVENKVI